MSDPGPMDRLLRSAFTDPPPELPERVGRAVRRRVNRAIGGAQQALLIAYCGLAAAVSVGVMWSLAVPWVFVVVSVGVPLCSLLVFIATRRRGRAGVETRPAGGGAGPHGVGERPAQGPGL